MVIASELGQCSERRVVGLLFSCVSYGDFRWRLLFFLLVIPRGCRAGVRFVVWGIAPVAESVGDAIGFACLFFFQGSGPAPGCYVFRFPGGCVQIHGISSVCGCWSLGAGNSGGSARRGITLARFSFIIVGRVGGTRCRIAGRVR